MIYETQVHTDEISGAHLEESLSEENSAYELARNIAKLVIKEFAARSTKVDDAEFQQIEQQFMMTARRYIAELFPSLQPRVVADILNDAFTEQHSLLKGARKAFQILDSLANNQLSDDDRSTLDTIADYIADSIDSNAWRGLPELVASKFAEFELGPYAALVALAYDLETIKELKDDKLADALPSDYMDDAKHLDLLLDQIRSYPYLFNSDSLQRKCVDRMKMLAKDLVHYLKSSFNFDDGRWLAIAEQMPRPIASSDASNGRGDADKIIAAKAWYWDETTRVIEQLVGIKIDVYGQAEGSQNGNLPTMDINALLSKHFTPDELESIRYGYLGNSVQLLRAAANIHADVRKADPFAKMF